MNDSNRAQPQQPQPRIAAGIYTRISLAVLGDMTKVDDQERICRELAGRLGWDVAEVYCDHSKSAWQKNRKRPGWNRMLADVDSGHINAIVVYHGDRLVRRPEDLADLIRLADSKGVKLASPTGTHDLDKDRLELWIRAAFAEEESQRTSERRKAQYERWRRDGRVRPGGRGGRAFGFATDGVTHIGPECDLIRKSAAMILDGHPSGQVARMLNEAGAVTPTGGQFQHGTVRKMLARPRYAGLMPDGEHPAAWAPVLDRETWEAVRAILGARAQAFPYATNARRYLLSGIAVCSECGSGLQIRAEHHRPQTTGYGCVKPGCRKVQRSVAHLDEYVTVRLVARLAHPLNPGGRVPQGRLGAELEALALARAETEDGISDPMADQRRVRALLRRLDAIGARMDQLREQASGDARSRLLEAHAGITRGEFADLPLATRRALVSACFTVTVLPAGRRGPGFDPATVRVEPR